MKAILAEHFARYPKLTPQDAVKLLYQAEFGGGHMISDRAACLRYLETELDATEPDASAPLFEEIGGGWLRLGLAALKAGARLRTSTVSGVFAASAAEANGSERGFLDRLDVLRAVTACGGAPFTADELESYLSGYLAGGIRAVSHSDRFRRAYSPAYRVVRREYAAALPVLEAIDALETADGARASVCIDGMCASGKTTLAARLEAVYACPVAHMDDFFLPPELRTTSRLAEAGGNIHYERFEREVVPHLGRAEAFTYGVFDCGELAVTHRAEVPPAPLLIVEGSYSMHPRFGKPYALCICTRCTAQEQLARLRRRCSPELFERFKADWIPMERRYFDAFGIYDGADVVLDA